MACNGYTYPITSSTNNSSYAVSYKMIRADNVIILSEFTSNQGTQSQPTSDEYLKLFIASCTDVTNGSTHPVIVESTLERSTGRTVYIYSDLHNARETLGNVIRNTTAAMTVLAPVVSYLYPLRSNSLYYKLQSQCQLGKMKLGNKNFISGNLLAAEYKGSDTGA